MITALDEQQVREMLHQVASRQPGLLIDLFEQQPRSQGPPHEEQPDWCTCGRCIPMPSAMEEVCCRGAIDNCLTLQPVSLQPQPSQILR